MLTFRKTVWSSGQDSDSREHTHRVLTRAGHTEQGTELGANSGSLSGGPSVPRMTSADSVTGSNPPRSSSILPYPRRPEA